MWWRVALVSLLVSITSGCAGLLGVLQSGPSPRTIVDNRTTAGYVAQIDDYSAMEHGNAFVAIKPMDRTVIDTQGEMNSSTTHVWLWDLTCTSRIDVVGSFGDGGIVTIADESRVTFVAHYSGTDTPIELDTARASCEEAAAALD
jgi:hypothetical protein